MAGEEVIEPPAAVDAEAGLQRSGGIVEPGVDDLGVARRHALADAGFPFQDNHRFPALSQRIGDRQADGAGAYDRGVKV